MEKHRSKLRIVSIVLACLINMGFGLYAGQTPMLLCGALGMIYAGSAAKGICA